MLSDSFSPTGGTEKVAAAITQNWPGVQTIDLSTDFASFFIESDSLVLVAMPSFGDVAHSWQLIVLLRSMEIARSAFLCSIWESRLWEYACSNGGYCKCRWLQVIAAISAIAEHSIIHNMPQVVPMQKTANNSLHSVPKFLKKHYPAPWQFPPFPASVLTKNPAADCSLC